MGQAEAMDQMYRFTRHVYDLSRKYYLLGRDKLIDKMELRPAKGSVPADKVLEIGCGTARNLILLAQRRPGFQLYGLDASQAMLDTAAKSVEKAKLTNVITLKPCLAEELSAKGTFDLDEPFDVIFFSYSLSMIPTWSQALETALNNLKPGRKFYIVDFCDQADLPGWFSRFLKFWLSKFHVFYRPEMLEYIRQMEKDGKGKLEIEFLYGRYAYIASFEKPSA
ncbi:MAG: class I SAM-dependent methyltransferase [Candidatus Methylacidiphilales bacterium]|nr:methyltransferase domain-containing protein [Candidatus Methylacidiphilales bacterium]